MININHIHADMLHLKQRWLSYLRAIRHVSAHTHDAYSNDFDQWCQFFAHYTGNIITCNIIQKLTLADMRACIADRAQRGMNPRSTARFLSSIKSFIRFLIQEKIISDHILLNFRTGPLKKRLPRPLSHEDAFNMVTQIQELTDEKWIGVRNHALCALLYSTGMRISEALSLKRCDIQGHYIHIIGKGNKSRHIPLMPAIQSKILNYLEQCPWHTPDATPHNDTRFIFYGARGGPLNASVVRKIFQHYRHTFGLPDTTTPHAMRHSCATHLVESSSDLRSIQELLGHASLSSTQLYTDVAQSHVHAVFKKTHPRQ